ncbi:MAG: DNA primase, partial [Ignavibacteriales bacterium]|nr:DNA primase [Ignavibacteriales bacterium]
MRIPPEKIEEIRNAIDIVDLIGSFVHLKKRGKSYIGLCPFHTEKTPSFTVSSERQMYHCFGCGVGGNSITFVMEYEKVSFVEAVRSLAEKAGIAIPTYSSEDDARASEQEELYNVCKEVGLFYYRSLTETTEGKLSLEYFHHRGFTDETIRIFGLGYSPNSWEALIDYARERKFSLELLEKAGLVRKRDDGTYHDYFRGRAMFPILSTTGRVLGFGARKLFEDDPLGKYINSPETLIYNKSRILYGLYQAKEEIRDKDFAILVEGYADLISVFQAGIKNVVASSGTALTQEQIQLISRYTKNITIMYDADSAGSKAALRGVDLILENDLDVRVAPLPEGDDPDSFVQKNGANAFRKLLDEAVSFIDFIARSYEKEGKLKSPEGQAQTVRAIVQTIAKMKDELKRNFYIKQVAEKYRLYESTLFRELEKILGETRRFHRVQSTQDVQAAREDTIEAGRQTYVDIPVVERDLIHVMLEGGSEV